DSTLPNSSDRLAILRHFVAQPLALAPMLDQLTGLATRLLGVPIAYVVLGDAERQTIVSSIGLSGPSAQLDARALANAIFRHSAGSGQPLLLDDKGAARLAPGLAVAAFAGTDLLTAHGSMIGALCVADNTARSWSPADRASVADAAATAAQPTDLQGDMWGQGQAAGHARRSQADLELRLAEEVVQRKALAYALVEAQKRESLSTLASGIAHNF